MIISPVSYRRGRNPVDVYVETHLPTTNTKGLVSLEIGTGSIVSGTFSAIDWSAGPYFIKTETDPAGSMAYTITGKSQLLSVPYALYGEDADADPTNEIEQPTGGTEGQVHTIIGGVPVWADPSGGGGCPTGLAIGDTHEGGLVFYLADPPEDLNGDGVPDCGLVAAPMDQDYFGDFTRPWGCFGTDTPAPNVTSGPSGPGAEIGDGQSNTTAIVNASCIAAGDAARICDELILDGFDDWFLPSAGELDLMYTNLHQNALGGFGNDFYWSSTEFGLNGVWIQDFSSGSQSPLSTFNAGRVRAVLAF